MQVNPTIADIAELDTMVVDLQAENKKLRRALIQEWAVNHDELCGDPIPPYPHRGKCHWHLPRLVSAGEANKVLAEPRER